MLYLIDGSVVVVGDKVRNLGLYPCNCDGVVVNLKREFWQIDWAFDGRGGKCWRKTRAHNYIVVKMTDGKMKYYNDYTKQCLTKI